MKVYLIIVIVFISLLSCRYKGQETKKQQLNPVGILIPTFDTIKWNSKVLIAIDSFLKEAKCPNCINEIYIDKILPNYVLITLISRVYEDEYLAKVNPPLYIIKLYGKDFYVYTGLEDVLKGDKKHMIHNKHIDSIKFSMWTLVINRDSLRIIKAGAYPFFPSDELSPYSLHKKSNPFHRKDK